MKNKLIFQLVCLKELKEHSQFLRILKTFYLQHFLDIHTTLLTLTTQKNAYMPGPPPQIF